MTDPRPVYAIQTGMVQGIYKVNRGDIWDADDPVVKAAPYMFTTDATLLMLRSQPAEYYNDVEQVTAAPGEKRGAVRRG
jgi:hypothetical protein